MAKQMMHLLFDFDGTLADSFDIVVQRTNVLASKFNFKKIKNEEISMLRDLSAWEIIKYLNIPFYKIPLIIHQMIKYLHSEIDNIKPIDNIPQVLVKLRAPNITLGILTTNSVENVSKWLYRNKVQHLFHFICNESRFLSKKQLIKNAIRTHKINPSNAYYICDETRDIEAAKQNNIKTIAVTWGYNSEKALLEYNPSHMARTPKDLLTVLGIEPILEK